MASLHRFNLAGLTDLVEELAGMDQRLPMFFRLPDGRTIPWARLSIEMVTEDGSTFRALVITPIPD